MMPGDLRHFSQTECNKLKTILHQVNSGTFQLKKIMHNGASTGLNAAQVNSDDH